MTIPIAFLMGFYLRVLRPGRVLETTAIGVTLLLIAIALGGVVAESSLADFFTLSPEALVWCLIVYGFVASVLPVWMLLAPRDYLSTFMKIGTILLLAVGIIVTLPVMKTAPVTDFASNGQGPVFAGALFPFVFITIACGALSGFHSLIASGTTPKMIEKETQVRFIGYGAMLMESFVAVMAIIAASIIDPGLYFAMNSPAGVTGGTVQTASEFVNGLGFAITPDALAGAAQSVEEESLISKTGGAPTLAIGMSTIFAGATGEGLRAFWYHFAIMFEALFILTTVDAGTRVGRFMLQDTLGNVIKPFRDVSWKPGVWLCSALIVGAWGYFLYAGVTNPLGGINQLFPLFGIANQLLAAVALTVCTTLLIKAGKLKWAWVTGIPLGLGRHGHAHRLLPEGVLQRPEARLLRAARQVPGCDRRRRGDRAGQDDGRHARGGHELDGGRHPRGLLRHPYHRRDRRRRPHLCQGHPLARAAAEHRGARRGVAAARAERPVHARGGARMGRALRFMWWYIREVSGESAYDHYVEHARQHHPGEPVMSRRDFERRRQDAREHTTQARCC